MRSLLQLKAQSNLHLFRAITSSEGPQRTLPPEIKLPRGNPCNLRNLPAMPLYGFNEVS
jgi:hypothetical protein